MNEANFRRPDRRIDDLEKLAMQLQDRVKKLENALLRVGDHAADLAEGEGDAQLEDFPRWAIDHVDAAVFPTPNEDD